MPEKMTEGTTTQTNAVLIRAAEADKRKDQCGETVKRQLLREHRMEILVNEQLFARLVCTCTVRKDLEYLVIGRLVTEGIISDISEMEQLYLCESGNRARVFLKHPVKLCALQGEEPTCCTDNQVLLRKEEETNTERGSQGAVQEAVTKLKSGQYTEPQLGVLQHPEWVFRIAETFVEDARLHKSTGGTHSCMLALEDRIHFRTEDIGRHNALDKAIGYAVKEQLDRSRCILFTTGRVPTDMVRKVAAAGIPVLISKAVPTLDAVEFAKQNKLMLICRAWPDSFEVYAG